MSKISTTYEHNCTISAHCGTDLHHSSNDDLKSKKHKIFTILTCKKERKYTKAQYTPCKRSNNKQQIPLLNGWWSVFVTIISIDETILSRKLRWQWYTCYYVSPFHHRTILSIRKTSKNKQIDPVSWVGGEGCICFDKFRSANFGEKHMTLNPVSA